MKKVRSFVAIIIGLFCFGITTGCTSKESPNNKTVKEQELFEQNFTLINNTGTQIKDLCISPAGEEKWGSDVLKKDTLASGNKVDIVFSTAVKSQYWDLKATDKKGNKIQWRNIDLFTVSEITLNLEGLIPTTSIK